MKISVVLTLVSSVLFIGNTAAKGIQFLDQYVEQFIGQEIASFIKLCHRHDPKINDCLIEEFKKIVPRLKDGIPELLLPPFEPLVVPVATLNSEGNFNATFKNIRIHNLNDLVLKRYHLDFDKLYLEVDVEFPMVWMTSDYEVHGKILVFQLDTHGPSEGNLTNVSGQIKTKGKLYTKNGKEHAKWEVVQMDLQYGKPVFKFGNIFGDNEELNERTNKVFNENIETLIIELGGLVKSIIQEFVFGIVNRMFEKFSMDELFPDP